MISADNIREWRGYHVVDVEGDKIGEMEAVYVDTATDEPAFLTVKIGILGRQKLIFVPLTNATVGPEEVRTKVAKKLAKDAPSIDTDGELPAEDEQAVFAHYGIDYAPGVGGERKLARR